MTGLSLGDILDEVTAALPHAETRPGQRQMSAAVADAITDERHLIVQAGTGTGKTIAYLVPVMMSGRRTVIATATKALQDQLANKDLPLVSTAIAPLIGRTPTFAILKGRGNYVCRQRLAELAGEGNKRSARTDNSPTLLELDEMSATNRREIDRIRTWASSTKSGDVAELDWAPLQSSWRAVSVDSDECPGARRCPLGGVCFAELARDAAAEADIVVVNTHLYGLNVAADNKILPEHEVLVVDEAHNLEDIISDTVGISFTSHRFASYAGVVKRIVDDPRLISDIVAVGTNLKTVLSPLVGRRIDTPHTDGKHGLPVDVFAVLANAQRIVSQVNGALSGIDVKDNEDAKQRKLRAESVSNRLFEALQRAVDADDRFVSFVTGGPDNPALEIAPLDVGPVLAGGAWGNVTAVLTSATIPANLPSRVGLPISETTSLEVDSPFDYESNSLLYCAKHLPQPNSEGFTPLMHRELERLITAAGGRTLALFTSFKAMDAAVEFLRTRIAQPILSQRDYPKNELVRRFSESEESCLFATAGFFQGIDIPGRTLSLVTIDRIPFPRPDDPLLSARRDAVGTAAFSEIDLPRAATLLAQATGRLIRTATDRGVVAVFDSRLATKGYRAQILAAMPPMRRTIDIDAVVDFLELIDRG